MEFVPISMAASLGSDGRSASRGGTALPVPGAVIVRVEPVGILIVEE